MLESIRNKFQFKFKDRTSAANILAAALIDTINRQRLRNNNTAITVVGIPRGGVVLADVIATKVKASSFDVVIPRKLRIPHNEEAAFGAIMGDDTLYIDDRIVRDLDIPEDYIENEKKLQLREIERRCAQYTQGKSLQQSSENKVKDMTTTGTITTTILVDDGAASGATVIAAARSIRKTLSPNSKLIIALPVAPKDTVNLLRKEADHVEVITKPSFFNSVGQYYQNFEPVDDEKVIDIIKNRMNTSLT
jgi:putative phosphoribosyl transferase